MARKAHDKNIGSLWDRFLVIVVEFGPVHTLHEAKLFRHELGSKGWALIGRNGLQRTLFRRALTGFILKLLKAFERMLAEFVRVSLSGFVFLVA